MTHTAMAASLDWDRLAAQLDQEGHALAPLVFADAQVRALTALCDGASAAQRVPLASQDLGRGDWVPAARGLPAFVGALQSCFYEHLAPVANRWNARLGRAVRHPATLRAFLDRQARAATQVSQASVEAPAASRSHFSVLQAGDYEALHQCSDSVQGFAFQLVVLLSAPGTDFSGGAFVMTEQRPRMQSRPIVLPLTRGSVAIIAAGQRPHAGTQGDYTVNLRHAIGRVHGGRRVGLELLFHDTGPLAAGA